MKIPIKLKPFIALEARVIASAAEHEGVKRILLHVQRLDAFSVDTVAVVSLEIEEALELAERIAKVTKEAW